MCRKSHKLSWTLAFFFAFSNRLFLAEFIFYGASGGSGEGEGGGKLRNLDSSFFWTWMCF